MKRLVHKARVLVTDGTRALVLRNDGDVSNPELTLVRGYEQENPPTREHGSDRPGRTRVDSSRRAAMQTPDWHALAEATFVTKVAADMDRDLRSGEFDVIVVVAAPGALGDFRKAASPALAAATIHEIPKDLVKHNHADIAGIVTRELDRAA